MSTVRRKCHCDAQALPPIPRLHQIVSPSPCNGSLRIPRSIRQMGPLPMEMRSDRRRINALAAAHLLAKDLNAGHLVQAESRRRGLTLAPLAEERPVWVNLDHTLPERFTSPNFLSEPIAVARGNALMTDETAAEPAEPFEVWLLRRVAQAVEASEVPANLLTQLQGELHAAREKAVHAVAIRFVAELAGVPRARAAETLAAIEAQPEVVRTVMMRRLSEAWLERQRQDYDPRSTK